MRYTQVQKTFLKKHSHLTRAKLTKLFNKRFQTTQSKHAIACAVYSFGFTTTKVERYSKEQIDFIKKHYKNRSRKELTELFNQKFLANKSTASVAMFCGRAGLLIGRIAPPPRKPSLPLGTEKLETNGYIRIKVAQPDKWAMKHRYVWEQANGKIPSGKIVTFIDGNPCNCALDNLILVSRREQGLFNVSGFPSYPSELKPTLRNLCRLKTHAILSAQEARNNV